MNEMTGSATGSRGFSGGELQVRVAEMIKVADETYRRRAERRGESQSLPSTWSWDRWKSEIGLLAVQIDSYELEWRLSRWLFVEGEMKPRSYDQGAMYGRRAIRLRRDAVEGHFWAGVNLALYAQARKGPRGLLALLEARRDLKRACEISEEYHGAGPLRVLGRLEHKSSKVIPKVIPKVMGGGSLERSRNYYDRALAIAPTNSVTLVYAAELEIDCRNSKRAVGLLERVLSLPIDPDWEFENIRDKNLAKSLLELLRQGG
jgi:hypothetical protein